jgi:hypothetical protein
VPRVENPHGIDVMITIFCDFRQFSAKKLAFFSKTNVMIKISHILDLFWVKNSNYFAKFFGENIFKIITSVPGLEVSAKPLIKKLTSGAYSGGLLIFHRVISRKKGDMLVTYMFRFVFQLLPGVQIIGIYGRR